MTYIFRDGHIMDVVCTGDPMNTKVKTALLSLHDGFGGRGLTNRGEVLQYVERGDIRPTEYSHRTDPSWIAR